MYKGYFSVWRFCMFSFSFRSKNECTVILKDTFVGHHAQSKYFRCSYVCVSEVNIFWGDLNWSTRGRMFFKNWNIDNQKWTKLQLKPNKQKSSNVFFHILEPTHFRSFISLHIWHIFNRSIHRDIFKCLTYDQDLKLATKKAKKTNILIADLRLLNATLKWRRKQELKTVTTWRTRIIFS